MRDPRRVRRHAVHVPGDVLKSRSDGLGGPLPREEAQPEAALLDHLTAERGLRGDSLHQDAHRLGVRRIAGEDVVAPDFRQARPVAADHGRPEGKGLQERHAEPLEQREEREGAGAFHQGRQALRRDEAEVLHGKVRKGATEIRPTFRVSREH